MARYNFLTAGYTITDEVINRSSATAYRIGHDLIKATGFVVRTGAGGTGTLLTLTTDYVLSEESTAHTTLVGSTIYKKLAIVNGAYHDTDLYVSYTTVGDMSSVENITEIAGALISPLTGTISANTTYPIDEGENFYKCVIPKAYLVASANGPFTLTITTGVSGKENVIVPITKTGDTILSPSLVFNVYVNADGDVMSDQFEIAGSNANGTWVRRSTGEMTVRRTDGTVRNYSDTINSNIGTYGWSFFYATVDYTFPATFVAAPDHVSVNGKDIIGNAQLIATTGFRAVPYSYYITYTINGYSADGRWRA